MAFSGHPSTPNCAPGLQVNLSFIDRASLGRTGAKPPRADLGLGVGTCHNAIYCVKTQLSSLSPTWATWARRGSTFSPIVVSPLPTVKTMDATLPTRSHARTCAITEVISKVNRDFIGANALAALEPPAHHFRRLL